MSEQKLCKLDPVLGKLIKKVGACSIDIDTSLTPYQSLVRSVVYQQLTGKAAASILNKVLALYPSKKFPTPEDIISTPDDTLRSAGLSRSKVAAIKDIALKTKEGVVPTSRAIQKMSNEEILERLTSIRGVGPWTVEMMLIFKMGRPDVLPITDYGVRKGFALAFGRKELPSPKELAAYGIKWAPYRSMAAWYLWRAVDLELTRRKESKDEHKSKKPGQLKKRDQQKKLDQLKNPRRIKAKPGSIKSTLLKKSTR